MISNETFGEMIANVKKDIMQHYGITEKDLSEQCPYSVSDSTCATKIMHDRNQRRIYYEKFIKPDLGKLIPQHVLSALSDKNYRKAIKLTNVVGRLRKAGNTRNAILKYAAYITFKNFKYPIVHSMTCFGSFDFTEPETYKVTVNGGFLDSNLNQRENEV